MVGRRCSWHHGSWESLLGCALLGGNGDDVDPVAGEGTGPSPVIAVGVLVVGVGGSVVRSWLHGPGQIPRIETVQSSAARR